jgi:HlyD family secretion protein
LDIKRDPPKKTKQYVLIAAGVVLLTAVTVGVSRLKPAAPTIERSTLWIDSVRRGDMIRAVSAAGNLVPEHVRIISSVTSGRVEVVPLRPGAQVEAGTMLLELSNPDLTIQILQFESQLASAISGQASLKNSLKNTRMSQQNTLSSLELQYRDAERQLKVNDSLYKTNKLVSANDLAASRDRANQLKGQLDIEKQRIADAAVYENEQIRLGEESVARTKATLDEQRRRLMQMRVTAGESGVLQSINLEPGQWVNAGTELARVVRPDLLKAVLRVPESQAKDVAIGQSVTIDLHNNTTVKGHVSRMDPSATAGTVNIDVSIEGPIPAGARADQSVDGTIEIQNLRNVLFVGRPVYGQAESTVGLFVLTPNGDEAIRKTVKLGKASVSTVEVLDGLTVGEKIIITDMTQHDNAQRVRIKN